MRCAVIAVVSDCDAIGGIARSASRAITVRASTVDIEPDIGKLRVELADSAEIGVGLSPSKKPDEPHQRPLQVNGRHRP